MRSLVVIPFNRNAVNLIFRCSWCPSKYIVNFFLYCHCYILTHQIQIREKQGVTYDNGNADGDIIIILPHQPHFLETWLKV